MNPYEIPLSAAQQATLTDLIGNDQHYERCSECNGILPPDVVTVLAFTSSGELIDYAGAAPSITAVVSCTCGAIEQHLLFPAMAIDPSWRFDSNNRLVSDEEREG